MLPAAFLLKVSRPRFWIYVFGPYLIGLAAGAETSTDLLDWRVFLFGAYFLFPANLLIYGINDIFDYDTDRLNEKKSGYETIVESEFRGKLIFWILAANAPFIVVAAATLPFLLPALAGFLFFSIFYSSPPIRAKAIPFLDSAFNILYIFPGILAYRMLAGDYPPISIVIAGALWTAAMHAYSAVPDIQADMKAGLSTIATTLGTFPTLAVCGVLYISSAVLAFKYLPWTSVALGAAYAAMIIASFRYANNGRLFSVYRWFPVVNAVCGFLLFWSILLSRLSF